MRNESNVVGLSGCTINRPDQHFAKGLSKSIYVGAVSAEESPGSRKPRCRITSGEGDLRESATENKPPSLDGKGETVR